MVERLSKIVPAGQRKNGKAAGGGQRSLRCRKWFEEFGTQWSENNLATQGTEDQLHLGYWAPILSLAIALIPSLSTALRRCGRWQQRDDPWLFERFELRWEHRQQHIGDQLARPPELVDGQSHSAIARPAGFFASALEVRNSPFVQEPHLRRDLLSQLSEAVRQAVQS
jgi:hypothetical protein